jgi:hypothetical protein
LRLWRGAFDAATLEDGNNRTKTTGETREVVPSFGDGDHATLAAFVRDGYQR